MENQLEVIVKESGLDKTKADYILEKFKDSFALAAEWERIAKDIVVTNETQIDLMDLARAGRLALREKRIDIEKERKKLKEQALREGKAIDGIANVLKALIEPIENYLDKQEHFIEYKKEAEAEKLRLEVEKRIIEEQIAKEKADKEQMEKIRLENARLMKEAVEQEKIREKEKEKQDAILFEERKKASAERERQEKILNEERIRANKEKEKQEAKLREERKKADMEKEKQQKIIAEERLKAEEEKERQQKKLNDEKVKIEKEKEKVKKVMEEKKVLERKLKATVRCPKCGFEF